MPAHETHRPGRIEANGRPETLTTSGDPVEWIEAAGDDDGEQRLPRVSGVAYSGGLADPRGFPGSIVFDLAGMRIRDERPMHRDHNTDRVVGHTTRLENDGRRLRVEGVLSVDGADRDQLVSSSRNGFPWRLSVGLLPDWSSIEQVERGQSVQVNGRTFHGPVAILRRSTLREISFVSVAGDDRTSVAIRATGHNQGIDQMGFEQWLKARGIDASGLSDERRRELEAEYEAEMAAAGNTDRSVEAAGNPGNSGTNGTTTNATAGTATVEAGGNSSTPTSGTPATTTATAGTATVEAGGAITAAAGDMLRQYREQMAAETERCNRIRAMCAEAGSPTLTVNGQTESIEAMAIRDGWDLQRTELELLREARASNPGHVRSRDTDCTVQALQGSLMLRAGCRLDAEYWGSPQGIACGLPEWLRRGLNDDERQRVMEAAHRYSDMALLDVCREAIRLDGRYVPTGRTAIIEAAFSGASLSNIFTTNFSAQLLASYMEAQDTTRSWTRTNTDVPNYLLQERVRLEKGGTMLKKLGPGGTAEDATRSDNMEAYRIARYARKFTVDDMDVINDRFGAIPDMPREMGLAAARLRPDLVYAILLANPEMRDGTALFHADHANLAGSAALSEANLEAALQAIAIQQENGVTLNLRGTHLIVPVALRFTAHRLINSAETRQDGGGPTANVLRGAVREIIDDARLDNGVTDPDSGTTYAGSSSTWYVASTDGPTIEVGYLRGSGGAPRIRSGRLSQGQFGIWWDVQHNIGAKALDWLTLQKRTAS